VLKSYAKLLADKNDILFLDEDSDSKIDFWQCDYEGQGKTAGSCQSPDTDWREGFWHKHINTKAGLYQHLRIASIPRRHDPKSRFM
jgi:hypothetical protein